MTATVSYPASSRTSCSCRSVGVKEYGSRGPTSKVSWESQREVNIDGNDNRVDGPDEKQWVNSADPPANSSRRGMNDVLLPSFTSLVAASASIVMKTIVGLSG